MKPNKPKIGYNPTTGKVGPIIPIDGTNDDDVIIGYDPLHNSAGPVIIVDGDDEEDDNQ
jgi:hypothetical protein